MKRTALWAVLALMLTAGYASAAYQVGDTIGDFTLYDADGNAVSLYDYYGKVVFINFWGSG